VLVCSQARRQSTQHQPMVGTRVGQGKEFEARTMIGIPAAQLSRLSNSLSYPQWVATTGGAVPCAGLPQGWPTPLAGPPATPRTVTPQGGKPPWPLDKTRSPPRRTLSPLRRVRGPGISRQRVWRESPPPTRMPQRPSVHHASLAPEWVAPERAPCKFYAPERARAPALASKGASKAPEWV
jgi:hypothetical protein